MKHQTLFAVVAVFTGCSVSSKEPGDFAIDRNAPRVEIVSPVRGTVAGDVSHVLVTGTASDDSGLVASVIVNGIVAQLGADGTWAAQVPVAPGTTLLNAIALDAENNRGEQTRAIVAGPMVELDRQVEGGIHGTVSAPALLTLGHNTATFIEAGGLMTAVQDLNPIVDVGNTECFYGQATITSLTIGNAEVLMGPIDGGIMVSSVLEDVRVGMHLQWAVACEAGSRDIEMTADRVTVQGLLGVGVVDRKLDIQFEPAVQSTGFDPQLPGVPDGVVQMLALDSAISPVLRSMTKRVVVPMVTSSLAPLDATSTVEIAGMQVDVDVEPTQISFSPQGGMLALHTSLRARGDSGGFVFVPNGVPNLEMKHGFELAVADDAANQLLASMWSAKAFDMSIDLQTDAHAQIGKLYDSVQLQLMVPPHINASTRPLELTFGDWIATFKQGDEVVTTVAIHATAALYVAEDDAGKLHMNVSTPAVDLDLVGGGDWITKEQRDTIKAFAAQRIIASGSSVLAAVPLPVVGNAMADLWVEPEAGFMLVAGSVE